MTSEGEHEGDGTENFSNSKPSDKGGRRNAAFVILAVAIVLIASVVILITYEKPGQKGGQASTLEVTNVNMTSVAIPLTSITQTASWYEYDISGSMVRFFAVRDANGTIHTAFDECPMCYSTHLGYRQNGTMMVENCCNMTFPIDQITEAGCTGMKCHPIFLPSTAEGDQLVIDKTDFAKERFIFLTSDEAARVSSVNLTHVSIPLSSISTNATWYQYEIGGSSVRFFAVRDANGTVRTAFDDCPVCYSAHLGYRQSGVEMVENCCNMPISIENISETGCSGTGCYPIFLPSTVEDDHLVIKKSVLAKQRLVFLMDDETKNVQSFNSTHLAIPLSSISAKATWYQYDVGGTFVRFFAVNDTNGTTHTALDTCWKCYKAHLGFRQEGTSTEMIENCCNMPFSIENITEVGCSIPKCHPVYLASQVIGGQLVIAGSDLTAGVTLFN